VGAGFMMLDEAWFPLLEAVRGLHGGKENNSVAYDT
jgi:hypothetical protein